MQEDIECCFSVENKRGLDHYTNWAQILYRTLRIPCTFSEQFNTYSKAGKGVGFIEFAQSTVLNMVWGLTKFYSGIK
jgi:hypothetical protein